MPSGLQKLVASWPRDTVHWQLMAAAGAETRSRLTKFLEQIDKIDGDPRLTGEGKREERAKIAEKVLGGYDGSSMRKAEESVAAVLAQWQAKISKTIAKPTDAADVAIAMQVRDRVAKMKGPARMAWLGKHANDPVVAGAILTAPQSLSELSDAEWALVKHKAEARALPLEIIEAKASVEKAFAELQRGERAAKARIAGAGGLNAAPASIKVA